MKMSDGVEWAIHCAAVLAQLPEGRVLPGKALAEYHGVSESYLLKHLKSMAEAGIVRSLPGPRGGYRLAKPADKISYLEIVRAVDGLEPAFRCTEIRQRGPVEATPESCRKPCAINATMLKAELAWRNVLREETVAKLVVYLTETLEPKTQEDAKAWFAANIR